MRRWPSRAEPAAPMLRHLPNLITGLRMVLVVPLCCLIADRRYDSALMIAAAAGASDALDGYLARRFGWRTWIGGMLDPIADKLLLTGAFVSLWLAAELPGWLVALIVARDAVIVAGAFAYHWLVGRFDADPSQLSKTTTMAQIGFVLVELLNLSGWLPLPADLHKAAMLLVAAITLASGLHYVWIWGTRARRANRKEERHE